MECNMLLKEDGSPPHEDLIIIPVGSTLTFRINPCNKIVGKFVIYCNAPATAGDIFDRDQFRELPSLYSTYGQFQASLTLFHPGPYTFKVNVVSWTTNQIIRTKVGHFLVPPNLSINGEPLPFNSIALQSVLSICLGPSENWLKMLKSSSDANYNFIHFTPLQTTGISGSCYSLYDHCELSGEIFNHIKREDFKTHEEWEISKQNYLQNIVQHMEKDYRMLSMVDIVLNHVSQNSPHLPLHKDMSYNLDNSPHLEAAIELHKILVEYTKEVAANKVEGVSPSIKNDDDVNNVLNTFKNKYLPKAALWEYLVIDVEKVIEQYKVQIKKKLYAGSSISYTDINHAAQILSGTIYDSNKGHRDSMTVNIDVLCQLFPLDTKATEFQIRQCINIVNMPLYDRFDSIVHDIFDSLYGTVKYRFVTAGGGKKVISEDFQLVEPYFNEIKNEEDNSSFYAANNGFIWNGNVREDFTAAGKDCAADTNYLRRKIVIWGDCVKLRYGSKPSDSQWLWDYMTKYICDMAKIFHGIRLDNAHGTPIHVSSYLLDKARSVNHDLLVCAELFTGDNNLDKFYVSEIGINMLIREAMQAPTPFELSRFIHMCGGRAVGSVNSEDDNIINCGSSTLPAVLYDCTHDNETPTMKRTSEDTLSNGILCCMACCPYASTRGYDEIIPSTLSVVTERRQYNTDTMIGIIPAKKLFNKLHEILGEYGYNEIHVHHDGVSGGADLITIQRNHNIVRRSVITIVRTSFGGSSRSGNLPDVFIPGNIVGVIASCRIDVIGSNFKDDPKIINGFQCRLDTSGYQTYSSFELHKDSNTTTIHLNGGQFPPGSVLSILVESNSDIQLPNHILNYDECIERIKNTPNDIASLPFKQEEKLSITMLKEYLANPQIDLAAFNILLYRCDNEERDVSKGQRGIYGVKDTEICFAGIAGICIPLKKIIKYNDMGHPIFNNLREGNWLMDYTVDRLSQEPLLVDIQNWLKKQFEVIKKLPRGFIPVHFCRVMMCLYNNTLEEVSKRLSPFCRLDSIINELALTSVQLVGYTPSGKLNPNCPDRSISMPAGFPHFSTGYMRNWGRDTFIALRGLLLTTGRYNEAKFIILNYASALRHGLIPNLLDGGLHARYNARDATWFFLYSIHEYCNISKDYNILNEEVTRLYPSDNQNDYDENNHYKGDIKDCKMRLCKIIQEILEKHANGIKFREWNAGQKIDSRMQDGGFNINIRLDRESGFIYGGNRLNCGSWMDKMGESMKSGSWGVPSTPRDGCDIEILGLLKNTLRWLVELHEKGLYEYDGVDIKEENGNGNVIHYKYKDWNDRIERNFEKHFYIPVNPKEDKDYDILVNLIRGRGYYKDVLGSSSKYSDYQLRPNCLIAMVVAPELFNRDHVHTTLLNIERYLLNDDRQLGIKTLSYLDGEYRGYYNNDAENGDISTDKGFNYHQGPEWLWPYGYYLRSRMLFPPESWDNSTSWNEKSQYYLGGLYLHNLYMKDDHWNSLPELTNENGVFCSYSCRSQSWSTGTLLDALYDLSKENMS